MEWDKSVGDWIEQDSLVATIYEYDIKNDKMKNEYMINTDDTNFHNDYDNNKNNYDKSLEKKIISYIDISKDRDIAKGPNYAIELLRSLAVKSVNPSDTHAVNSCITGLFSVLVHIFKV